MSNNNTCEYCKVLFSSKSALTSHQKKARYCLVIQLQLNPETPISTIPCQYCRKNFTRKCEKNTHESTCKNNKNNNPLFVECEQKLLYMKEECEKKLLYMKEEYEKKLLYMKEEYEKKVIEKDIKIKELIVKLESEISKRDIYKELHDNSRNVVDKLATQPKNNISNNILNNIPPLNINSEHLSQAADTDFSKDLFLQGQAGVAKFFMNYIKESNNGVVPFVVSDKSRDILKYKNGDQEIVTDNKALKLTQLAFDAVKTINQKHYDSFYMDDEDDDNEEDEIATNESDLKQELADKCFISIKKLPKDNKVFRKKIIEGCEK